MSISSVTKGLRDQLLEDANFSSSAIETSDLPTHDADFVLEAENNVRTMAKAYQEWLKSEKKDTVGELTEFGSLTRYVMVKAILLPAQLRALSIHREDVILAEQSKHGFSTIRAFLNYVGLYAQ